MKISVFHIVLGVALLSVSITSLADAPTMLLMSGTDAQYAISSIGRLTFSDGTMYLLDKQGQVLGSERIANVGRITFGAGSGQTRIGTTKKENAKIQPTETGFKVDGLKDDAVIRVFSFGGQMLSATKSVEGTAHVNTKTLATGAYLLQVNTQVVKFIIR